MKILIDFTPISKGGGLQVAIWFLESVRLDNDNKYLFVCPLQIMGKLPLWVMDDSRFIFIHKNFKPYNFLKLILKLHYLERAFNPDIVYCLFGPSYWKSKSILVTGFAIPSLIYERQFKLSLYQILINNFQNYLRILFFKKSDYYITETLIVKKRLSQFLNIDASRIFVIPNCINPLLTHDIIEHNNLYRDYLSEHFIFVPASYYKHKNLEIIPYVSKKLNEIDKTKKYSFILTLTEDSDDVRQLCNLAIELDVKDSFYFVGSLDLYQLKQYYLKSDCVFLPTLLECFTAVYLESFYFEKPLITSDLDFAHSICKDAAIYIDPFSFEDSANAIFKVCNDKNYSSKFIERGRLLFSESISPQDKFTLTLDVFSDIWNKENLS